jgi:riboflavin synthase
MFTGIIHEIGSVEKIQRGASLIKFGIRAPQTAGESNTSDSIAVNGACLTLVEKSKDILYFEVIASSLARTNLKRLKKGDKVNVEPALRVQDKLGGHFVLGHVDAEGRLRRITRSRDYWTLECELPGRFRRFTVENGSIAIDGISLTVKKVLPASFRVDIVPFTYNNTNLPFKRPGTMLNLEFDYLLKKNSC